MPVGDVAAGRSHPRGGGGTVAVFVTSLDDHPKGFGIAPRGASNLVRIRRCAGAWWSAEECCIASKGRGYRTVEVDGYEVLVGKGARENDELTFGVASPRDVWLHAAGYAGSHVVVRAGEDMPPPPRHVIERAAQLAAWYSKARDARGKVEVHVCRVADVRKPRGFPPGKVEIRNWDAVRVYPKGDVGEGVDG